MARYVRFRRRGMAPPGTGWPKSTGGYRCDVGGEREPASGQGDRNRRVGAEGDVAGSSSEGEPVTESEPNPADEVDEWGYESFPASDPPQH
jgi:hypothetical protein